MAGNLLQTLQAATHVLRTSLDHVLAIAFHVHSGCAQRPSQISESQTVSRAMFLRQATFMKQFRLSACHVSQQRLCKQYNEPMNITRSRPEKQMPVQMNNTVVYVPREQIQIQT